MGRWRRGAALAVALLGVGCNGRAPTAGGADAGATTTTPQGGEAPRPVARVDPATLPVVQHALVAPPAVPPPITRRAPAKVVVHLEVRELRMPIADGATYTFWTYGGTVPGPMLRVRRGDVVEFHLQNHPQNTMPHNIDLHAVTGPAAARRAPSRRRGTRRSSPSRRSTRGRTSTTAPRRPSGCTSPTGCTGSSWWSPTRATPASTASTT